MEIISAQILAEGSRKRISEIFVHGFYQWLRYFSKDKQKLTNAFAHMFNNEVFYVCKIDGQIAGVAAFNDGKSQTVRLIKSELQKHLGWIKGWIAYKVLRHEFEEKKYPFEMKHGMGAVEFVATSPEHRGIGVASAIIGEFLTFPEYKEYVLEVADTNTNAVKLYEKLGFQEFMRVEMKNKKQSGINFLIYMSYKKPEAK